MRIAIREQLAVLVLLAVLVALAIVSIPVWVYVNQFVVGVTTGGLTLTASLRASQIASELNLIQTTCNTITSRLLLQTVLTDFYHGNDTQVSWSTAGNDLQSALDSGLAVGLRSRLLQARVYSRNTTGARPEGLLNVTGSGSPLTLPYPGPDGSPLMLGEGLSGFPPELYPNITYYNSTDPDPYNPGSTAQVARPFPDVRIDTASNGLILGPLMLSETDALVSFTTPIRMNGNSTAILGYMTVVADASSIIKIAQSQEGLGSTGSLLLVGPATGWNRFSRWNLPANATHGAATNFSSVDVRFVLPPVPQPGQPDRHTRHNYKSGSYDDPWKVAEYDAVYKSFTDRNTALNNASSMLYSSNEQGAPVAVGYARPPTVLVNWTVIVEQDTSEADIPIHTLREILLGCVFGTAALVCLLIFPCAHFSVKPIRELKSATEKSVAPPGSDEGYDDDLDYGDGARSSSGIVSNKSEKGFVVQIKKFMGLASTNPQRSSSDRERAATRTFKIPSQVKDRKHIVTDELTELTTTFNEMSRELEAQYTLLEDKVAIRTQELEISKKAAEAANESKTLFIANISHELKTPLNGILGMCAICMEEDDMLRIKQSLKTLYKSGDLLLHLLEDLLSFSKNQIGQQLALEEREFRLGDIRSQILTIFDKQVREGAINFSVAFLSTDLDDSGPEVPEPHRKLPALGPVGTGRIKDMCLWGDQHRILQVLINLVSNSLKFTPSGGKVSVRIRCLHEIEHVQDESRSSSTSRNGSNRGRARRRVGSGSNHSTSSRGLTTPQSQYKGGGTVLSINPMDPKAVAQVHIRERSQTPPPSNAKSYMYEFEVEDSGPGIAEHMHDRVFEPFVQGDLGLSKKYGGTGLGLSICQQLAHLMGGNITLRSTVGVGTTFTMHIPLKYTNDRPSSTASSSMRSRHSSVTSLEGESRKASVAQAKAEVKASVLEHEPRLVGLRQPFFAANPGPQPVSSADEQMKVVEQAAAQKGTGKLRVLVADDNQTNVEVVTRMLKLEDNYDVTIATDGQEAYDLVKANMEKNRNFDLILMDIQMPNLDGLQSTRLIRKMGYSAPIVALTAFSEESNKRECIESGMDEFLAKPIRRPALKQVLKKFATIPEEPETASLTKKSTKSEKSPPPSDQGSIEINEKASVAPPMHAEHIDTATNGHTNGHAKSTISVSATPATSL
ncbi:putative histidine kinase SlnCl1 [Microdochium bolleyi]|uniref:histidine kinase n=1 Tax=Microdochium bolleyi TaxID=196109 RepID=A0A136J177_9PEZI|nr:putative histidine kinase SlnCl1 [Microdochium bolleyi]